MSWAYYAHARSSSAGFTRSTCNIARFHVGHVHIGRSSRFIATWDVNWFSADGTLHTGRIQDKAGDAYATHAYSTEAAAKAQGADAGYTAGAARPCYYDVRVQYSDNTETPSGWVRWNVPDGLAYRTLALGASSAWVTMLITWFCIRSLPQSTVLDSASIEIDTNATEITSLLRDNSDELRSDLHNP